MNKDRVVTGLKNVHGAVIFLSLGLAGAIKVLTWKDEQETIKGLKGANVMLMAENQRLAEDAKAMTGVAAELRKRLDQTDERRARVFRDNVILTEQAERDAALLEDFAAKAAVGSFIHSEHIGQWEKTGLTGEAGPLWTPADTRNRAMGARTIWALRRMKHQGTVITEPANLGEAMANMTSAMNTVGEAMGKAIMADAGRPQSDPAMDSPPTGRKPKR